MKPIDFYGVKLNILFVATKTHQIVIVIFIKIFSIDESQILKMIHRFIKGINNPSFQILIYIYSFSNKIDFVFPTDETSSSGTTTMRRDKNLQESNGRVWTEFSDIKQVLAG